jgi:pimeloyl-ACP methyl ester carboxylesterase
MDVIRKRYVESSVGEIHVREIAADNEQTAALICLHPAPSSGLYFATVLPLLNNRRRVIAPDYPGYGGSAKQDHPRSIEEYAGAMLETIDGLEIDGPVDLFGFHTGCLVALEMALQTPQRIAKLVLCDVPYFSIDVRQKLRADMAKPMPISADLESLADAWTFNVSNRLPDIPLPRAFDLFVEHLRGGAHDYFAFDAAFAYPCEEKFAALQRRVDVIATQSGLLEPSRAAASMLPDVRLLEALEVESPVFETGADAISKRILSVLDDAYE